MNLATISVSGVRAAVRECEKIPAGIVGATVTFEFTDPLWDGLNKTAVFRGCVTRDVLIEGDTVRVPSEAVEQAGAKLLAGVYGVDADENIVIPTVWASLGMIRPAADPSGDPGTDPELPIWAHLQAEVEDLKKNGTGNAGTLYVTATSDNGESFVADKSSIEIAEAVAQGRSVILSMPIGEGDCFLFPLSVIADDGVLFSGVTRVDEDEAPALVQAVIRGNRVQLLFEDMQTPGGNVEQEKYLGDLTRTPIYRCLNIYLDGDTTGMTKDNAVMLDILILDEYGNVKFDGKSKTSWQGSGSLQYPNKNLSLKLRDKNDEESKVKLSVFPEYATSTYHLKCNYADYSMVRNSVGAKMAMSFDDTELPADAPMVISSVPAILYLNGEFNGCYTLNTKQDDDLFGMDTEANPLTQIVYRSGLNGWNLSNFEYRSDGTETAETQAKLTRLLNFAKNSDDETFVRDFESYLSLRNAINYWIFADVACASDNLLNNWTIATWDGNKWYMLWYDLDIIFGLFRNAGLSYHPSKPTTDLLPLQYTTPNPIWAKLYRNFFDDIKERYWKLRNSGTLTATAIVNPFRTFQSKWGTELIEKERAKWTGRLNKTDDIDMMHGWISERLAALDEKYTNKILTGISVTYNGGDVNVGTAVSALSGVTVTATYDDGTSKTVTGYTLNGTIVEGENTITASYGGMTTTFTVTGVVALDEGTDLPDGYTNLAYIEGTGTQYIDTETIIDHVYDSCDDEFYIVFTVTNTTKTQVLFGDDPGANSNWCNQFAVINGKMQDFVSGSNNKTIDVTIGERYLYRIGLGAVPSMPDAFSMQLSNADTGKLYEICKENIRITSNSTDSMFIMAKNTINGVESATIASMRLYEFYYKQNGNYVVRLIPVLDADGKPCMYDMVAKKAHYNQGTGEFVYA